MVDVFDEVDEQIRAERFRALVRRTVPYFIGALIACVAVVVGIWAYGQFSTAAIGKASLAYAKGMDLDQKGDADAASWLPANKPFRCAYVATQVKVKARYRLWVTQAEHDAMARVLSACG